ncbi:hypothetical protein BASA60_005137 [Batrachochytrium salamandrivorans]|nr:hypothetical protein BASA60_005137 [Batrachochytrium salamandrivorans]
MRETLCELGDVCIAPKVIVTDNYWWTLLSVSSSKSRCDQSRANWHQGYLGLMQPEWRAMLRNVDTARKAFRLHIIDNLKDTHPLQFVSVDHCILGDTASYDAENPLPIGVFVDRV